MKRSNKTIKFINKLSGQVVLIYEDELEGFYKFIYCYKDQWIRSDNPKVVKLLYRSKK
jgi:hypothetical protein